MVTELGTPTTSSQSAPASALLGGRRIDDRTLPTRPRRRGLLALAGLLIAGSALAGAVVFSRAGDRVDVLAVRDGVAKGHTIEQADLITTRVAGISGTFSSDAFATVVGSTAVVDLLPGQILTENSISADATPLQGEASVGLYLDPANVPAAGLEAGDLVDVIAVPSGENAATGDDDLDAPVVLAEGAQVFDVSGSATEGGGVLVTLLVPKSAASRIAAYSTADRVAIVEVSATDGPS